MSAEQQTDEQKNFQKRLERAGQFLDEVFYPQIKEGYFAEQRSQAEFETWLLRSVAQFQQNKQDRGEIEGIDFSSVGLLQNALRRSKEMLTSLADKFQYGINQVAIHLLEGSVSMDMDNRIRDYRKRFFATELGLEQENMLAEAEERLKELDLDMPLHGMVDSILYMERTGKLDAENIDDLAEAIRIGLNI